MTAVRITAGLFIIAMGLMAVITGDFGVAGGWIIALGLAAIGVAGLVSAATSARADAISD